MTYGGGHVTCGGRSCDLWGGACVLCGGGACQLVVLLYNGISSIRCVCAQGHGGV